MSGANKLNRIYFYRSFVFYFYLLGLSQQTRTERCASVCWRQQTLRRETGAGPAAENTGQAHGGRGTPLQVGYTNLPYILLISKLNFNSSRIVKVYSASRQVVSGTLTRIDADLTDSTDVQHRCIVEIWAQPWLEKGHEVTFKCRNQPVVHARHSRSVEWAEKKTHKKHAHHTLNKVDHLFHKFQIKYKRRYANSIEHQMRLRIFRQNLRTIEELNANEMGSAKYGITEFADMTSTEYTQRAGLWQRSENQPTGGAPAKVPAYAGVLPKDFDWRQKNAVTQVKNQGQCGSCWAFSVTGNIEGLYAIKTGDLQEFSEQELLDCDSTDSACNGGLMDNAYK